ncbi:uncharacterized protein LOC118415011 [Branchiostoma floridae]|uniref:chitinase n=1 Tax=Branchiostoma floridae TaxID=7739 RepID=A0A9J7MQ40_BRAFL|nr:uncharacterized protein LOC118415011 [Branchiostoma floridae]
MRYLLSVVLALLGVALVTSYRATGRGQPRAECPANSHWSQCDGMCRPTCADPRPMCPRICVPGCVCDWGHVWFGERCIPLHQCRYMPGGGQEGAPVKGKGRAPLPAKYSSSGTPVKGKGRAPLPAKKMYSSSGEGFSCEGKPNGDYADPEDCTMYYDCSNGIAYHMECPDGLYFNEETDQCDNPANVDCGARRRQTARRPTKRPVHGKKTSSSEGFSCEGKPDGDYADPEDCTMYYDCSNGIAYHMDCPDGLYFNEETDQCDNPANVDCGCPVGYEQHGGNCYKAYDDKKTFDEAAAACQGDGGSLAMPRDQATHDFLINLKNQVDSNAHFYLGFDDLDQEGDWRYIDGTPLGTFQPWGPGEPNNLYGDENCGEIIQQNTWNDDWCFEEQKFICQTSLQGARRRQTPRRPTRRPVHGKKTSSSEGFSCEGKPDGDYADPEDCTMYYDCSNGIAYHMECPDGLYFNEETDQCDNPANVDCGARRRQAPRRPTRRPVHGKKTSSSEGFSCEGKPNGDYADPEDCTMYYDCSNGIAYHMECPDGLYFNEETDQCDNPANVDCGARLRQTPSRPTRRPVHGKETSSRTPVKGKGRAPLPAKKMYSSSASCPQDNSLVLPSGKTYLADDDTKTHSDAQQECRQQGGIIAIPRNEEEQQSLVFLKNCVNSAQQFWLGIVNTAGVWRDGKGIPLGSYASWAPGEPNEKNKYCAHIVYGTKEGERRDNWADAFCDRQFRFVCEIEAGFSCEGKPNGDYADPEDCTMYYDCSNGIAYHMECPDGLYFNEETDQCDNPANVDCGAPVKGKGRAPLPVKKMYSSSNRIPRRCLDPKKVGPCKALIPRVFFNKETGQCEDFTWGGCQSNGNNFKTMEECENTCAVKGKK